MPYIEPEKVISPKANWRLVDVVLDRGAEDCAYAIGMWDNKRCIGFRWNGTEDHPLGNPQSRGLPTWTILDRKLHQAIRKLVKKENPAKAQIVQAFFGKPVEDSEED
jgi:hypothetical protein